jgi:O-antigen/teichoic acid export membrane protein
VIFIWNTNNFIAVISVVALGALVTAVSSLLLASRLVGPIRVFPTTGQMKGLLIPALPLGITLLFNLVYFRADSVIITLTRPTAEVGVYGLAYKVFEVVLVFPTFFMNAVYPLLLGQKEKLKTILRTSFLFLFIASLVSGVALWVAAPLLLFIKNDFASSIGALRVLALGLPFFFVTSVTMWGLVAMKKQAALAAIYGGSMAINIVGNLLFVPTYGFMAAAWMTMVGEAIVLLLSSVVLLQNLHKYK